MRRWPFLALLLLLSARLQAQELRGLWVDAFSDGIKSPQQVETLIRRAQLGHFNALFVQVRKSADAYYASRHDPWASDNPQRFDALGDLVAKAHAAKPPLQVHAWINACAVGRHRDNPHHITLKHPEYVSLSVDGKDHDGEAKKIDPGHPEAAEWTARVALDIVRRYEVDGIHLDFIRYGGTRWGYSAKSVRRFNLRYGRSGQPNPKDPLWMQWRRDQVTALVRRVYALCKRTRPQAAVSAATIAWMKPPASMAEWTAQSAPMVRTFQDWRSWLREGILDLNCTMTYYDDTRHPDWFDGWTNFAKRNRFGRQLVIGVGGWLNARHTAYRQIARAKKPIPGARGSDGVIYYSYNEPLKAAPNADQDQDPVWKRFVGSSARPFPPPFQHSVRPPAIKPNSPILSGAVIDQATGQGVDGAVVTLKQGERNLRQRTDGLGNFAFARTVPGKALLTAESPVGRAELQVNHSGIGTIAPLLVGRQASLTTRQLKLLAGDDRLPGRLLGETTEGLVQVRLGATNPIPYQAGDTILVTGSLESDGEMSLLTADPAAVHLMEAAQDTGSNLESVIGKVTEIKDGWMRLETRDGTAWAPMGEVKLPGVEDEPLSIATPKVGERVYVFGEGTQSRNGKIVIPTESTAVVALGTPTLLNIEGLRKITMVVVLTVPVIILIRRVRSRK